MLGVIPPFPSLFTATYRFTVTKDSLRELNNIKKLFQMTFSFWEKLSLVENELNLSFDLQKINSIDENALDIEELYVFLVKKKPVRLNARLTSTEYTGIILKHGTHIPNIGSKLDITFTGENTYSIFGQSIVIYTANLLTNAIIKEIAESESGEIKILYSDTDSMPMYISSTGFKTSEEADIEKNLIMSKKGLKKEYSEAITATEYLKQEKLT